MSLFSGIKWIAILSILLLFIAGLYYISNMQTKLNQCKVNTERLTQAIAEQQEVIETKQREYEEIRAVNLELTELNDKLSKDIENLNDRLNVRANGTSRDFGKITRDKPVLINKIINRATDKVNRCFELASGAPLKEGEKNSECEALIDAISNLNY